ncbi:MAG: histidine--tRNA ligase [Candidatus Omnitrophota bacterium]|jgi:histidyl-tRNA synthetase
MIKHVRGTQDILPQDSCSWQKIEEVARRFFSLYGYQEIRTPILEEAALFNRSLGETTEIIQKQMFKVAHNKDHLVLRPEGTASVIRAYLENNLDKQKAIAKLYYFGPMFRAERPQKGRLRQFHHLGIEAIGSLSPQLDIEVISLTDRLLKELGINKYQIQLNSLGCAKDKLRLSQELRKRLKDRLAKFCLDCQNRFKRNIFRVLDCKNLACQKLVSQLDLKQNYLCTDCKEHFQKVISGLKLINFSFQLSPFLVRGLDYYTRTVFEIKHTQLGAQDALGAGGRYDNLVEQLGGKGCGAIGFAFGIERILLVGGTRPRVKDKDLIFLIALGEPAEQRAAELLHNLRSHNMLADMDYASRSLKGQLRQANDLGARFCVIIGEDELSKGTFSLKDMVSGVQKEVKQGDLLKALSDSRII